MKIQVNLYEHREKDEIIMQKLGLYESANPNALVRDILYKVAMEKEIEVRKQKPTNKKQNTVNNRLLSGMNGLL